ncbi:MAG: type II secretion system major pseudopilin GspG [Verrucomicrobiota bacterium]
MNPQPTRPSLLRGFTLIEMMIVLGILTILIGGSAFFVTGFLDDAKLGRVDADFNKISTALQGYENLALFLPSDEQGLEALVTRPSGAPEPRRWTQKLKEVPIDPWGTPYQYLRRGRKKAETFEIISAGPDEEFETEDDLSSQSRMQ